MRALITAACALFVAVAQAQSKPLFTGEQALDSCVVELPLTYAKKDKERYTQAARFLENDELIYLTYHKKTRTATYSRVFVVVETTNDGKSEFVYIESAADHRKLGGTKTALFVKYTPGNQRFYNAACFDRQLAAHPELQGIMTEEKVGAKP